MATKNKISPNWAFFKWFLIHSPDGKELYLKRLRVIQTPWFAFYIHWIYVADNDRHLHNHPWNFYSFIWRGGYVEEATTQPKALFDPNWWGHPQENVYTAGHGHWFGSNAWHRIIHILPGTITLVFTGKRMRKWGFYTENGFVPWDQYERLGSEGGG